MQNIKLHGIATALEEFTYPDQPFGNLPDEIRLAMPRNGRPGVQLLLETDAPDVTLVPDASESFTFELYELLDVPVEYNTGDGVEQGGAMVLGQISPAPDQKPAYVTRKAPFRVYDCIKPSNGCIPVKSGRAAAYICAVPSDTLLPGEYTPYITIKSGDKSSRLKLLITVYDVAIPRETLSVTNWFSLDAIERFHKAEYGTPEFMDILAKYARAMRRCRQTHFFISLDERCIASRDPWEFRFEHLEPLIKIFFDEGFQGMEIGGLLSRGFLPDGAPDMYSDSFKCAMATKIPIDTAEGYAITVRFVQDLAKFLSSHGWQENVLFHIHDEPDIHIRDAAALNSRKRQYYLAASILRKYLPNVKIIEAVSSAEFRGGIDVWVPGTSGYESQKDEFDRLIKLGEEVWAYVCCGPEGQWLNRFLDFALIKPRLLFWGCANYGLSGFLHWGFNQFLEDFNPFEATSCPNYTGLGTNFPCGDAFIVYPGDGEPWISMRLEALRRGAEDAELLNMLRARDEEKFRELIHKAFVSNTEYEENPSVFADIYSELLALLSGNAK